MFQHCIHSIIKIRGCYYNTHVVHCAAVTHNKATPKGQRYLEVWISPVANHKELYRVSEIITDEDNYFKCTVELNRNYTLNDQLEYPMYEYHKTLDDAIFWTAYNYLKDN